MPFHGIILAHSNEAEWHAFRDNRNNEAFIGRIPEDVEKKLTELIKGQLAPKYAEMIGHEIQKAYLESYSDYGQNLFERYISYADAWIEDQDFKDSACRASSRTAPSRSIRPSPSSTAWKRPSSAPSASSAMRRRRETMSVPRI